MSLDHFEFIQQEQEQELYRLVCGQVKQTSWTKHSRKVALSL
jgi:hypothetical protein